MEHIDKDRIYLDYKGKVTGYVRSKIADVDRVEDLVSDIFLKIYANLDRYDASKSALSTWIYTITSRMVLDYYRTRKVYCEIPTESGEEGQMPENLVDRRGLDAELLENEKLETLAMALEQLPERERDLIILHYYSQVTLKDVAQKMGMSYANAKIVHKKALDHLRKSFEMTSR